MQNVKCEKCGRPARFATFKVHNQILCHSCALGVPYDLKFRGETPLADALPNTPEPGPFSIRNKDIIYAFEFQMRHDPDECIAEVEPEFLLGMGTSCGHVGNRAFQKDVIDILKKYNINKVIVGMDYYEDEGEYKVFAFFLPISPQTHPDRSLRCRIVREMETAIEKHEGAAYADPDASGWLFFVSE
jgi:hypothetical protein